MKSALPAVVLRADNFRSRPARGVEAWKAGGWNWKFGTGKEGVRWSLEEGERCLERVRGAWKRAQAFSSQVKPLSTESQS